MTNVRQNCEIGSKHKTNVEKIVLVVNWQLKGDKENSRFMVVYENVCVCLKCSVIKRGKKKIDTN